MAAGDGRGSGEIWSPVWDMSLVAAYRPLDRYVWGLAEKVRLEM